MCRQLIYLTSLVLLLGLVLTSGASAADPSLIGWWKFDDGSGNTAKDSSGNGNDGTLVGDPQWVAGKLGGALAFGGDGSHVIDDDAGDYLNGLMDLTVSVWIKSNQTGTNAGFLHGVDPPVGQDRVFAMRYDSAGATFGGSNILKVGVVSDGGNQNLETSNNLQTTEWQHVAMTWTSGGLIEFFANGVQDTPAGRNNPNSGGALSEVTSLLIGKGGKDEDVTEGWDGLIDDVRIYSRVLSAEEIQQVMIGVPPGLASEPNPANEATDVPRDLALGWNPGEFAVKHDVYFGTAFDDVNNADTVNTLGVLASQEQEATTYAPDRLELGETYYWRVDEVNGAPDFAVLKGDVWRFSVEPIANPLTNVTVTASSSFGTSLAENTINGSGLVEDLHGTSPADMWISTGIPATIEYAFDRAYRLHELWVWNSNQIIEPFVGFGAKDVVFEHSLDGENWIVLEGVGPLAPAPGTEGYAHNNTIGFGGVTAQYVRLTVNTVQGFAPQASLSEVRFFAIPTFATVPSPDSGATNVAPDLTLSWGRGGREADRHDIYLGTDPDNLPLAASVTENSFDALALDLQLGETYSWRVDEVNETAEPSIWTGDIWSFTTVETISIDDMESYRDEEFFEIWATWVDGFDDPSNGSLVGNGATGSPETGIVYGGGQSLPLHYGNGAAAQAEATRTFPTAQDWSKHGVQGLVLFFHGSPANTGARLYVKINGTQVVYDGDPADLQRIGWHKWSIDLAGLPAATRGAVNSLTLGIDNGGAGVVYIDDILLTPAARELITPAELSPEGLVVYYPFDGDFQDASGNGLHGTGMGGALGGPVFEAGQSGQAILLDGAGQYVEITGYQGISAVDGVQQPFSISNWFKTAGDGEMVTWGSSPGGERLSWRIDVGNLRTEHGNGNLRGNTLVDDGEWHHAALVVLKGANLRVPNTTLYIDGRADGVNTGDDDVYNLTPGEDVSIGRRATSNDRFFPGSIDEVRIFDRALSAGEVAGLAGRTLPFDAP